MNVLVVSDNLELITHLLSVASEKTLKSFASFEVCCSHNNIIMSRNLGFNINPINLKNERVIANTIKKYQVVISLHCKQIFPENLIRSVRCINFHPGYNPYNRGWYPQVFSIINKLPAGVTVHLMDDKIDHGNIIFREIIKIKENETSLDVYKKLIEAEKMIISVHLKDILLKNYRCFEPEEEGNYNSKKDFRELCALDMNHVGSLKDHIDLLRALTHGDFKNAFFLDDAGKKIFVRVNLEIT